MHPSLWIREADAVESTSAALPASTDVVVIGGGIAGVSTALALATQGAATVLVEADEIASRASGRNDGQLLLGLGEHYNRIVGQFGAERARLLWDFIRCNNDAMKRAIARFQIRCDLADAGGLRLAETEHEAAELGEAAALLAAEGMAHEMLDARALHELLPLSTGFHAALRLPGEAIVQPAAMVRGFAAAAARAGAVLQQRTPVVAVERDRDGLVVVTAAGARLRTTAVVHCTSTLARELDASGFLGAQLFPFRGQILATDPLPDDLARQFPAFAMSSNFCYEYFRLHGGRFVVGGMRWSVPGEQLGIVDDSTVDPQVTANLLEYVARHFPALGARPFPHAWTGIMAGTADGLPLLGELPGQPGVFALLGFNGYGLSFAFEAGAQLARIIVEGRAEHPAVPMLAPRRFG